MEATCLVGSMHTFTQGYGYDNALLELIALLTKALYVQQCCRYGCRVPTERNKPGTPSEPVRRYPIGSTPRGVTSSILLQSAPNARERNMQNIQYLSSGAYGSFHHKNVKPPLTAPESGRRPARGDNLCPSPMSSHRSQPQMSALPSSRDTGGAAARSNQISQEPAAHSKIAGSQPPYAAMTQRTKMKSMLADLDSSFSRRNKYDLSTAIAGPPSNIQHLKLYGVANYKNFEEGGRWANSLRRPKGVARK